jgi:hypothetical protein
LVFAWRAKEQPQSGQMLLDQDFNARSLAMECPITTIFWAYSVMKWQKLLMFERKLLPHPLALITWAASASKTSV